MEGVLLSGLTLILVSGFILVAMERIFLLIQLVGILKGSLKDIKTNLGVQVKVNSRCGIDLLLGKKVGSRGVLQIDPTPVDKSVSC